MTQNHQNQATPIDAEFVDTLELATTVGQPAALGRAIEGRRILEQSDANKSDRDRAQAKNTKIAYGADWKKFAAWCAGNGVASLPCEPENVAEYLSELANTAKLATVERMAATLSREHKDHGFESPCASKDVADTLAGIRRSVADRPHLASEPKKALERDDLRRLLAALPQTLAGARDRALILLAWAGALRRSELVALDVRDLQFCGHGILVHVRCSKTDQEAKGAVVPVNFATKEQALCPVLAVKQWLTLSGIAGGAVFRSVNKAQRLESDRFTVRSVGRVVQNAAKAAGLSDWQAFGGHSMRAGFATEALKSGAGDMAVANHGRWKKLDTVRRYVRAEDAFDSTRNAGRGLL